MKTPDIDVLFVAGFGPISKSVAESKSLYVDALKLPLKPMEGNPEYYLSEHGAIQGAKHFAIWPLHQAAESCFGTQNWPDDLPIPQAWLEFDVADMTLATRRLKEQGYRLLVENRTEPWGQTVTRFLGPEGLLLAVTCTPWLRDKQSTE